MGIVDLIANSGKGGQTAPMRQLQMAQGEQVRQQTAEMQDSEGQRAEMGDLQLQSAQGAADKRGMLDDIAKGNETAAQWIDRLKGGGFMEEAQQAEKFQNGIDLQTQKLEKGELESKGKEAQVMSKWLDGVMDQKTLDKFHSDATEQFPESDIDQLVTKQWNDEDHSDFNIGHFGIKAFADSSQSQLTEKDKAIQDRFDSRNKQSTRRADQTDRKIELSIDRNERKESQQDTKRMDKMRKEYRKGTEDVTENLDQVDQALAAVKSGRPLDAKLAQAIMANMSGSKVRALAELTQYKPGNFGSLRQRIGGKLSMFIMGEYSDSDAKEMTDTLTDLKKNYSTLKSKTKKYYQYLAIEGGLDAHSVAQFDNPLEIMNNEYISREKRGALAEKIFPDYDWGP